MSCADDSDAAYGAEHQRPKFGDRRTHDVAGRLAGIRSQAHRRGVRLDQDGGQAGEDEVPWSRPRRVGLHLRCRRLQSGSIAEAHRGKGLIAELPAFAKAFAGRWRIVEMDVWDKDFLDLVETAHLTFKGAADGEIAFGALRGSPRCSLRRPRSSSCERKCDEETDPGLRSWMGCPWHCRPPRRTLLHPQRRRFRLRMPIAPDFFNGLLGVESRSRCGFGVVSV